MTENDYQLQKAIEFEEEGNYLHAIQIFLSLLKEKAYHRNASLRLVTIYEKMQKIEAAINVLDNYINEFPDDDDYLKYYCHFLIFNGHHEKALELLASFDFEENPEAYFLSGVAFFGVEEFESSKISFLQLLAHSEEKELVIEAYIYLAKIYLKLNNLNEADEVLNNIRGMKILYPSFYLVDAQIHYEKGMYFHAYELIREAEKLYPDNYDIYAWAGKILLMMEEYSKAEKYLLKSLKDLPTSEVYSMLGWACYYNKKNEDAEEYFKKALNIEPGNQSAIEGKNKLASV